MFPHWNLQFYVRFPFSEKIRFRKFLMKFPFYRISILSRTDCTLKKRPLSIRRRNETKAEGLMFLVARNSSYHYESREIYKTRWFNRRGTNHEIETNSTTISNSPFEVWIHWRNLLCWSDDETRNGRIDGFLPHETRIPFTSLTKSTEWFEDVAPELLP